MANRNYSLLDYFIAKGQETTQILSYRSGDVAEWQQTLRSKLFELLGEFPASTELDAETLWAVEEEGLIKEKVVFNSELLASVPAIVIKRADLDLSVKHPAILCLNG